MRTLLLADDNVTVQRVVTLMFADEAFHVDAEGPVHGGDHDGLRGKCVASRREKA